MITTPITRDLVDGVARDVVSQLRLMEAQPSGARIVVITGVKHKIFLTPAEE